MPTYEYRCSAGHEFEMFQRMSDESITQCPQCGAVSERLLSGGAGFIFRGDGFYITDYRSEDYKKAESSDVESTGSNTSDSPENSKTQKSESIPKGESTVGQTQSGSDQE